MSSGLRRRLQRPESHARGDGGLGTRLRQMIGWPWRLGMAGRELLKVHACLQQRSAELQRMRAQLELQAKLLRTANRISQVVHGEMDLRRTLETVVGALVDVADFAAADLSIVAQLDDMRVVQRARRGTPITGVHSVCLPVVVRGVEVGELLLWPRAAVRPPEALEVDAAPAAIVEFLAPTIYMAIDDSLTFDALLDYRRLLEQRVDQRTAESQQARDSLATTVKNLQEAQAARDRIFANINHEIRTPLALIMLAKDMLKQQVPQPSQDIHNIETSVRRLLDLVDGLLMLAAGQEGKLSIKRAPIDLAIFLQQTVSLWSTVAHDANLHLTFEGPQRCNADVDTSAMERVMSNLVSNAIKFTPSGGSIVLRLTDRESDVVITVSDTGVGIGDDFRPRIFGRFEQGRPAVRAGMRGSGIGLSLVKELLEAHDGSVSVADNPGGGSIFTLILPQQAQRGNAAAATDGVQPLLPLSAPHLPKALQSNIIDPPGRAEATILVAEDDSALSAAIATLLGNTYRVLLAVDGETALQLAEIHMPDLLISDVQMPRLDGIELSQKFRDLPGNRLAPVLLVTAHSDLASRLAGFDAGAVDYILKPFEPAELLARLRSQLALRRLAVRLSETEKLASLGVLSAGLAHELRNPANAVVNAIEPLCELLPASCLEPHTASAQLLDVIKAGAQQLRALSQQLLGFTRPGQMQFHEEKLDNLVNRALAMVSEVLRGIEVRQEIKYAAGLLCAGPLLVQVLTNLLENAAHAAGHEGWVAIHTARLDDHVSIDVSDSGPGVPAALRERIFEPFFTTKPPGSGSGLGLSTARTILERHHGSLLLVDSPQGATFRLRLPVGDTVHADAVSQQVPPRRLIS